MIIKEYNNIYRIRGKWIELYSKAKPRMSPFQSFIPNKIYYDVFHFAKNRLFLSPRFIFAQDGESEIIFPIIVDRRNNRITEFAPLDYYDVIFWGEESLIISVLEWIKNKYPSFQLRFSRVNQYASLIRYADASKSVSDRCVLIPVDIEKYEGYYQSLSKHQRQNIRTAYNRCEKESVAIKLIRFDNKSLPISVRKECRTIYEERKATKNLKTSLLKQVYNSFSKPVFNIMARIERGAFFVLFFGDIPAAFMSGAYSADGESFVVPILSARNDYLRYSPGIILINEVVKVLSEEKVKVLDLARGEEPYKYAMGGVSHNNYTIYL